jgi:hypothetical protein
MPSVYNEPTIQDLLDAFEDGVRAQRDKHVDAREGSIYQCFSGSAALLWSRAARRTTDLWRAVYLDSAESTDLTTLLNDRYDFPRIEDSYGTGTAFLRRPTATAGEGTVWRGTRLAVFGSNIESKRYVVVADTPVGATTTSVQVPLRAELPGGNVAINTEAPGAARVDDPLWDPTWIVDRLECANGTSFEPASVARARLRDTRRAARAGFVEALIQACKDAGAANAFLFPSDYAGEDQDAGLNMAYVGDAGFQGDEALVRKVLVALERWRVLGDNLQVRPLGRANLAVKARVYLWDSPTRVNQGEVVRLLTGAILGYFTSATTGFSYQLDALAGAMLKASPTVQFVEFDAPTADAGVVSLVGGRMNFPSVLTRYRLAPDAITLTLLPPL